MTSLRILIFTPPSSLFTFSFPRHFLSFFLSFAFPFPFLISILTLTLTLISILILILILNHNHNHISILLSTSLSFFLLLSPRTRTLLVCLTMPSSSPPLRHSALPHRTARSSSRCTHVPRRASAGRFAATRSACPSVHNARFLRHHHSLSLSLSLSFSLSHSFIGCTSSHVNAAPLSLFFCCCSASFSFLFLSPSFPLSFPPLSFPVLSVPPFPLSVCSPPHHCPCLTCSTHLRRVRGHRNAVSSVPTSLRMAPCSVPGHRAGWCVCCVRRCRVPRPSSPSLCLLGMLLCDDRRRPRFQRRHWRRLCLRRRRRHHHCMHRHHHRVHRRRCRVRRARCRCAVCTVCRCVPRASTRSPAVGVVRCTSWTSGVACPLSGMCAAMCRRGRARSVRTTSSSARARTTSVRVSTRRTPPRQSACSLDTPAMSMCVSSCFSRFSLTFLIFPVFFSFFLTFSHFSCFPCLFAHFSHFPCLSLLFPFFSRLLYHSFSSLLSRRSLSLAPSFHTTLVHDSRFCIPDHTPHQCMCLSATPPCVHPSTHHTTPVYLLTALPARSHRIAPHSAHAAHPLPPPPPGTPLSPALCRFSHRSAFLVPSLFSMWCAPHCRLSLPLSSVPPSIVCPSHCRLCLGRRVCLLSCVLSSRWWMRLSQCATVPVRSPSCRVETRPHAVLCVPPQRRVCVHRVRRPHGADVGGGERWVCASLPPRRPRVRLAVCGWGECACRLSLGDASCGGEYCSFVRLVGCLLVVVCLLFVCCFLSFFSSSFLFFFLSFFILSFLHSSLTD